MPPTSSSKAFSTGPVSRFVAVVFALALALSFAVAFAVDRWALERDRSRFERAATSIEDNVRRRLDTYVALLQATRGLFVASEEVELDEFRRFVGQLGLNERYPGLLALGFSQRVARSEVGAVESALRAEGQEGFAVWPDDGRDETYPIVFLEPADRRNVNTLGYDAYSDPIRRAAMDRARDTGTASATGPVTLVQESDPQKRRAVLVYVPVYGGDVPPATIEERRVRLLGFVHAAMRMGDLLGGVDKERSPIVGYTVYDVGPTGLATLYSSQPSADGRLASLIHLHVAGRTWIVRTEELPALYVESSRWIVPYVLLLGVVLSALLAFAAWFRAEIERQLRLHSRVLESMSEGVSVSDERGIILYTNAAEDAMFGYAPGELVGRHVSVRHRDPTEQCTRVLDEVSGVVRDGGTWAGEFSMVRKDGSLFITLARITGLHVGGRHYWICVQADITEKKRAEVERAELLERETQLRVTAEAASRAKDEFLAMLGHELRNPLAPIVTAFELIRRRGGRAPPELPILERQVNYLRRLVDDLLDVSRITRGQVVLDRRRTEVALAVDHAVELASPSIADRGHTLVVDVPRTGLEIEADEPRIVQVLTNLLVNAAKYTPPGGHITVSAGRSAGQVALRVRDDGIGIGPDLLPRVFELFTQGQRGADRRGGGLGIGLAVAKRLVELHGGALNAHSEGVGRGAEFEVLLPCARPAPQPARTPNDGETADERLRPPRLRVLVVDDNRDAAQTLAALLRAEGHEVSVAYDGAEALEAAGRTRFDAAILDVGLPSIDGYELARRLPDPRPTLFAVTGYGREPDRARGASAGIARHFVKPVSAAALLDALAELRAEPA